MSSSFFCSGMLMWLVNLSGVVLVLFFVLLMMMKLGMMLVLSIVLVILKNFYGWLMYSLKLVGLLLDSVCSCLMNLSSLCGVENFECVVGEM